MEDTANCYCSILFDILEEKEVRDVVCSPGSRNVPLLIAAAARENLKKHFAVDERSAAFLALGLSMVSQSPVAIVCTSGTALLDFAPAIAEAYYQSVPIIVISADRPIQWIDQDDSQTIRQNGAIDNFVKKSFSIPAEGYDNPEMQWYVNRIVNEALITALSNKKGPVHINVHLAEPLNNLSHWNPYSQRIIENLSADTLANKEIIKDLAREIANSKVLVVAGFNPPDSLLQRHMVEFSKLPNVTVMAETISNLHLQEDCYMIDSVLTAFNPETLDNYKPELIISLGGSLVSRKLKEFLRKFRHDGIRNWSLGYSHTLADPFQSLTIRLELNPARFFRNINAALRKFKILEDKASFREDWKNLRLKARYLKNNFIDSSPWSEIKAFDFILNHLPKNFNVFFSNGTAIRYAQIIPHQLPHASYCNRGVSGIDGSVSTAVGGSIAYKGETLLISGDLSFMYDIGALHLRNIPENFKIIVIDNQGGGIFRFIPSTSSLKIREEFLCQPPLLPLKQLAEGFNWDFFEASSENSLKEIWQKFISNPSKSILKITCDGELSAEILKNYMNIKYEKLERN